MEQALTQSEIQNYMSCPPTGNEAGLVGYWNFNEGSGNTVTDLTSNGNNGTINGASWSTETPNQYCNNCTATDSIYVNISPQDDASFAYSASSFVRMIPIQAPLFREQRVARLALLLDWDDQRSH